MGKSLSASSAGRTFCTHWRFWRRPLGAPVPTDAAIREQLLTELEHQKWAPIGFLNVVVRNGIVEFWGTITEERERQALVVAAQNTPGVKDVRDHLVWVDPMSGTVVNAAGEVLAP